jgi:hypothetical protein
MGCSCNKKVGNSSCNNKVAIYVRFKREVTTLYNTTTDVNKRDEYNILLQEINEVIRSKVCPSDENIVILKAYIKDEQQKYNKR